MLKQEPSMLCWMEYRLNSKVQSRHNCMGFMCDFNQREHLQSKRTLALVRLDFLCFTCKCEQNTNTVDYGSMLNISWVVQALCNTQALRSCKGSSMKLLHNGLNFILVDCLLPSLSINRKDCSVCLLQWNSFGTGHFMWQCPTSISKGKAEPFQQFHFSLFIVCVHIHVCACLARS